MKKEKKILMIFWGDLYPADMGNKKLVLNLLSILSQSNCFVTLCLVSSMGANHDYNNKLADDVILVKNPSRFFFLKLLNKVVSIFTINHLKKDFIYHQFIKKKVHKLTENHDLIILNYLNQHYLIPKNAWSKTAVITHDIQFYRLDGFLRKNPLKKIIIKITKKYELRLLQKVKNIIVLADYEKKLLIDYIQESKIKVINLPLTVPKFKSTTKFLFDFVFVGGDSIQNEKALEVFLQKVYPCFPDKTLCLVGSICNRIKSNPLVQKNPKIKLLGFVDNPLSIYEKSRFAVGTIDIGSGVKVKILEAMAHGKVVIANTKGLEGINAIHGVHIINIDLLDSNNLKQLVEKLYIDEMYIEMSLNSHNFIEKNYSFENVSKILNNL
jgi:glycosyltransferase involved in cell wall biosynthesis